MKIAVVGAGGVGGWLAARLATAGADVHVLARGAHLDAIRARGLTLTSPAGDIVAPVSATDDATGIGPADAVLFCVKAYDTDAAAAAHLPALCKAGTTVVSLQNGIDNAERLAAVVDPSRVVGGLALIASQVARPGVIEHRGGPARIVLGELDGTPDARVAELVRACTVGGIDARVSDRIAVELWDKFAFLCAFAGTTATTRLPIGDVRACAPAWAMFRQLVEEVYVVARAAGVTPDPDAVDRQAAFAEDLEPHIHASLYHDLVAGRRIELDALHATVVRLGRTHGVPTPVSEVVNAILRPHVERTQRDTERTPSTGSSSAPP